MPNINLDHYESIFPPKAGVTIVIEFTHTEAQAIKNADGLEVILGVLGGEAFGPVGRALVAGLVLAFKGEIGEKDKGDGVNFAVDRRLLPFPTTSVYVDTRPKPQPSSGGGGGGRRPRDRRSEHPV